MVQKIRNQDLGTCLKALKWSTKRGRAKTGQAKIMLPNLYTKMKVSPFVFTNHSLSIKINLFLYTGVLSKGPGTSCRLIYLMQKNNVHGGSSVQ